MKYQKAIITAILVFSLFFSISNIVSAEPLTDEKISTISPQESNNEILSLIVTQAVVIISIGLSAILNNKEMRKSFESQRNATNMDKISEIVKRTYDAFELATKAIVSQNTSKAEELTRSIDAVNEEAIIYCSAEAVKIACYYSDEMNKKIVLKLKNQPVDSNPVWLIAYLSVLHAVIKYEITGNRLSPQYLLSSKFSALAPDLYNQTKSCVNQIVAESHISKKYLCKNKKVDGDMK